MALFREAYSLILILQVLQQTDGHCLDGHPCYNGGTCVGDMDFHEPYCRCTEWWTGVHCQIHTQGTRIQKSSILCPNFFTEICPRVNDCLVDEDCDFGHGRSGRICCRTRCGANTCHGGSGTYQASRDLPVCVYDEWQDWSPCSVTCGGQGFSRRVRNIRIGSESISPESSIGSKCQSSEPWDQLRHCNNGNCPGNCVFTPWLAWSSCYPCRPGGTRTRVKQVYYSGGPWPTRLIVGKLCIAREQYVEKELCTYFHPTNFPCYQGHDGPVVHSAVRLEPCIDLQLPRVCSQKANQGMCESSVNDRVYMGRNCCLTCKNRGIHI